MRSSIKLGHVFGIEIGIHLSWLIIAVLVLLSLGSYFTQTQTTWSPLMQWSAAFLTALLFFASVVTHELGHSLMAQHYGIKVQAITLFLFGGVSQLERDTKQPWEEFWIAIVGPLTSFMLAGLFGLISLITGLGTFIGAITAWLATINFGLAVFNLLPGYPLDGGHVLRGLVWWKTGNGPKASRVAVEAGQMLAMLMIISGIMLFFHTGGSFSGLWIGFLGWFLLDAARTSAQQINIETILKRVTTGDLMSKDCPRVPIDLPISQFIEDYLLRTGRRFFLIIDNESVLGIITAQDLQPLNPKQWSQLVVGEVMRPFEQLLWVSPETTAHKALEIMSLKGVNQLPVISAGKIQGVITREHLIQLLALRMEFGLENPALLLGHASDNNADIATQPNSVKSPMGSISHGLH